MVGIRNGSKGHWVGPHKEAQQLKALSSIVQLCEGGGVFINMSSPWSQLSVTPRNWGITAASLSEEVP